MEGEDTDRPVMERGLWMDLRQRTRRFSASVVLCACILRLGLAGLPALLFPIYSETGQDVRFSASLEDLPWHFRESPAPWIPEAKLPEFSAEDLQRVSMDYDCALRPDLEELLKMPLDWNLKGAEPAVLILHTHTTESYAKGTDDYTESASYRTLEEAHNMLSIGQTVAEILTEAGITVIHDRQIHDYPSYNGSYVHSRSSTEKILEENPGICLILDLHRDALETEGKQMRTLTQVEGETAAQLMMVVGTDVSRQNHKNWKENLALALKLHVLLERENPGIMRPVNLRSQRFNQDLSTGALLIEVGAAGNTRKEALLTARKLAEAIVTLAGGCSIDHDSWAA